MILIKKKIILMFLYVKKNIILNIYINYKIKLFLGE